MKLESALNLAMYAAAIVLSARLFWWVIEELTS